MNTVNFWIPRSFIFHNMFICDLKNSNELKKKEKQNKRENDKNSRKYSVIASEFIKQEKMKKWLECQ